MRRRPHMVYPLIQRECFCHLQGMSDIKDMLERVQQRGVAVVVRAPVYNIYGRGAYNMAPIIKPTVWLTPEYFAAWLVEQQVCCTIAYIRHTLARSVASVSL